MSFTEEEIARAKESARKEEEAERALVRALIERVKFWQYCEHRICRRSRRCVETQTCQTRYAKVLLWWQRTVFLPYLRERYPTVQWGAPGKIVTPQIEAALAAEAEQEARDQARREGKPLPRKRKRKRVPRQPLYTPPDFVDEQPEPTSACAR